MLNNLNRSNHTEWKRGRNDGHVWKRTGYLGSASGMAGGQLSPVTWPFPQLPVFKIIGSLTALSPSPIYLTNNSSVPNKPKQTNRTSYFTFILVSYYVGYRCNRSKGNCTFPTECVSVCTCVCSHILTRSPAVTSMTDRTAQVVKLTLILPGPREWDGISAHATAAERAIIWQKQALPP